MKKRALSALLIDIDHFKLINDNSARRRDQGFD